VQYFPDISKVEYEGGSSKNPFAFKYYNANELVNGKSMKDHLRFGMSYWHTMVGKGSDPFGGDVATRAWDQASSRIEAAKQKADAAFELMDKLGLPYFCFHDEDVAPYGKDLNEFRANLDTITSYFKTKMQETGIKLLWGTSNCFTDPRFVHGASTSCNATVFAYAATKIKKMLEVTKELNGENFVFWGGREGYETLLNTNTQLELDNLARLFHMAVDYKKEIGFTGQFLIEPKPKEPMKHHYDYDAQTVISFLKTYGLEKDFKLNIEANHATLAHHTFEHELNICRINGMLGSIDANKGDELLGWDTDQFPSSVYDSTLAMIEVLKNGGIAPGGLNFDAKVRRASFDENDLVYGYINGMDAFAKGLKVAAKIIEDGRLQEFVDTRYSSYTQGVGKDIVEKKVGFKELEKYTLENGVSANTSGRQEWLESLLWQYILETK